MKKKFQFFQIKDDTKSVIDEAEIRNFYNELLKMKKNRPNLDVRYILMKCYPNASDFITNLIGENDPSATL